jgi:hypothetical protein
MKHERGVRNNHFTHLEELFAIPEGTSLLSEENSRLLRQIFFGFGEEGYFTKSK